MSRRLRAPRTLPARYGGGISAPPRFRPSLACASLGHLQARASQVPIGTLAFRSLGQPLRSFGFGRSGSASGFPLAPNACGVPSPQDPRFLAPAVPPCRNPFSRLRSKRGGFRRRPHKGGLRLSGGVPAPPLKGCVPAGTLRREYHRGTETAFLSLSINSPFRSPQIEGKTPGSVNRASLSVSNLTDSKFILDFFCNL